MSTTIASHVIIRKSFEVPEKFNPNHVLPTTVNSAQSYELTLTNGDVIVGTIADVQYEHMDAPVQIDPHTAEGAMGAGVILDPVWYTSGPDLNPTYISLAAIVSAKQMFIKLVQSKSRSSCPATASLMSFETNGRRFHVDDWNFYKFAYTLEKPVTDAEGKVHRVGSVYGYINGIQDVDGIDHLQIDAVEFSRGAKACFAASIAITDVIGIFRYHTEIQELIRGKQIMPEKTVPATDEDGDVLPTDSEAVLAAAAT